MFLHASKRSLASGALVAGLLFAGVVVSSLPVEAQVHGVCSNCHTMHNSQNGSAFSGNDSTPDKYLTILGCVGCHSSSGSDTIKTVSPGPGESKIPIVYNMTVPSYGGTSGGTNTLAGGNFYWLTAGGYGQEYAHNVLTIPGVIADTLLPNGAPGMPLSTIGDPTCAECHKQIADCTSCHNPKHHAPDTTGVVGEAGGFYRYLASPKHTAPAFGVLGIEDPDWEQTVSSTKHNEYNGASGNNGQPDQSLSSYCAGCHDLFHGDGNVSNGAATTSPWIRHPAHLALPADPAKEYKLYNTPNGSTIGEYSPDSPVARNPNKLADFAIGTTTHDTVTPGYDQVMCLSCHRPHGSPYKDLLRWPYQATEAGGAQAHTNTSLGNNWGCFVCHTTKDNK